MSKQLQRDDVDTQAERTAVPPQADLTACDREPIHVPGAIQPHGFLLGLADHDLRIARVSANVAMHLGQPPHHLLDRRFDQCLDRASLDAVGEAISLGADGQARPARITVQGRIWRALVHVQPGGVLLEAEPPQRAPSPPGPDLFERVDIATRALQAADDTGAVGAALAREVRRLTGHARVKVYRFAPDWSGEVIAEASDASLPSYLGLRFPASDIPVQARALYTRHPERQIPEIGYAPVRLLPECDDPIDLSTVALRSVSPVHLEYLRNMGVGASMSVSILRQGALWGMIACHHGSSRYIAPETRQAIVLLAQLATWRLILIEEREAARHAAAVAAVKTALLRDAVASRDLGEAVLRNGAALLDCLGATGLALRSDGAVVTVGSTPPEPALRTLLDAVADRDAEVFATDHLAVHHPLGPDTDPDTDLQTIRPAGVLAVKLGGVAPAVIAWFRPELRATVAWAGAPVKTVQAAGSQERLTPRKSFARWSEEVRDRSRPWTCHEIIGARMLRDAVGDISHSLDLERMNARLARSNEALEAFAYVASHDLKEPLRQIETFGTLLERAYRRLGVPAANVTRWFDGIQTSSRRLRTLVDDLARYARVGHCASAPAPVALDAVLAQVLSDLGRMIEESGGTVESDALPVIMCDATQMHQVLQNLISNALKYRHADRAPRVRVAARWLPEAAASPERVELRVADNGIGFEARHRERIFEPFERLHSADEYEGSGIGLAICRKIVDRHGGTIEARACLGKGAVFVVVLPARTLSDQKDPAA